MWFTTLTALLTDASELPLKPIRTRRSTPSTWSTEVNADEDIDYQKKGPDVSVDGDNTTEKGPIMDKQVADDTSGTGGWIDEAQSS